MPLALQYMISSRMTFENTQGVVDKPNERQLY
jgi:hypothetical protein